MLSVSYFASISLWKDFVFSDHCDGDLTFRKKYRSRGCDVVSRSVSLRLDDDGDLYESFSPADLEIKELLGKGFYGEVFKVRIL